MVVPIFDEADAGYNTTGLVFLVFCLHNDGVFDVDVVGAPKATIDREMTVDGVLCLKSRFLRLFPYKAFNVHPLTFNFACLK